MYLRSLMTEHLTLQEQQRGARWRHTQAGMYTWDKAGWITSGKNLSRSARVVVEKLMHHSFTYTYQFLEYLLIHEAVESSTQQFAALDRMSPGQYQT
jgi:hypothetical protein